MDEQEKKQPGKDERDSFEEISRLARQRDNRELEQRRNALESAEFRFRRELERYQAQLRQIETDTNLKIEDVRLLQKAAHRYCIDSSSYRSLAAIRDSGHLFYGLAQEIKNGPGTEAEKLRKSQERLFQCAQKENPYLNRFTVDDLLRVTTIFVPRRPNQLKVPGERALFMQVEYLRLLRIPFAQARDTLDDTVDEKTALLQKDLLPDHSERAKALLSEFLQQADRCSQMYRGSDLSRSALAGLQELTEPDKATGMNPADKMLDLYLAYLMELHQVGDDPSRLRPTRAEQKILKAIQTFSSEATLLVDRISGMLDGELTVPPENAAEENGKRIHRIDARGRQPKVTKGYYSKKRADENSTLLFAPAGDDTPLFGEGSPSPEDVRQGDLGDCYLLAGLTTLAAQDPQKIRDAMKDNLDGTVTVRFFNDRNEPVYVTVDKSVPMKDGADTYARGSLWVQIMERAYVQSGLHAGALEKAEADSEARKELREAEQALAEAQEAARRASAEEQAEPDDLRRVIRAKEAQEALRKAGQARQEKAKAAKAAAWQGSYGDIEGGFMPDFICRMLGSGGSFKGDYSFQMHFFAGNSGPYTEREQQFIQELREALADGEYVTTSTPLLRLPLVGLQEISGIDLEHAGLPTRHAYAITGVEQEGDRVYITVRNPHAEAGVNTHTDGELRMMDKDYAYGYSRLELRDFSRLFSLVFTNHYDMTSARMETLAEAKTITRAYGESVRKIAEALEQSDSSLLHFQNSDRFTAFKKAAVSLNALMQSPAPTPQKLNKGLDEFLAAAEAYSDYCENDKMISLFKDGYRAFSRYQAAKIAMELKPVVLTNRTRAPEDAWAEFSYSAAKKKVNVPADPADALDSFRSMADNMAVQLNRQEGLFGDPAARTRLYRYLQEHAEGGQGRDLAEKIRPGMGKSRRFDLLQKKARTVCTMYLLSGHADEVIEAMRHDGYLAKNPGLESRLRLCRDDPFPFADAPARSLQPAAAAPKKDPPRLQKP